MHSTYFKSTPNISGSGGVSGARGGADAIRGVASGMASAPHGHGVLDTTTAAPTTAAPTMTASATSRSEMEMGMASVAQSLAEVQQAQNTMHMLPQAQVWGDDPAATVQVIDIPPPDYDC